MRSTAAAGLLFLLLFSSCAARRIDGSSAENARRSIVRVRSAVQADKRNEFDAALDYLMSNGGRALPLLADSGVRARIGGKTAAEIVDGAARLRVQVAQAAHDEQVRREREAVNASLNAIAAADHPVQVSSSMLRKPADSMAGLMPMDMATATDSDATTPAGPGPHDDNEIIRAFCSRFGDDNQAMRQQCVQEEMRARFKMMTIIPSTLDPLIASRLQSTCKRFNPASFRGRLYCEETNLRILAAAQLQPGIIDRLPDEQRYQIQEILGRPHQ